MNDVIAQVLADGSAPRTQDDVHALFDELGIPYTIVPHAPMFTVEEARPIAGALEGSHIKNLFLRNKKGRMWVVTCHEDRHIDLRALGDLLGAGRFSFASAERMMKYLGVIPGAVTPLSVMNDLTGSVAIVLDRTVLDDAVINVHPLHNGATTTIATGDLLKFLETVNHPPQIVDMDALNDLSSVAVSGQFRSLPADSDPLERYGPLWPRQ